MNAHTTTQDSNDILESELKAPSLPAQQAPQPEANSVAVIPVTRDSVSRNWHNLDNRLSMIAEAAYFKAEKRGFEIGHEIVDWLEAEQELAEIMGET